MISQLFHSGLVPRLTPLALALALPLVLAACETVTDLTAKAPTLECPAVRLSPDVLRKVAFRPGDGRDLIDVDHQVDLLDMRLECDADVNRRTLAGTMEVTASFIFRASRGPANVSADAEFRYFLAVTDRANKILYRETFPITARFPQNLSRVLLEGEEIVIDLPLKEGQSPRTYRYVGGLLLTRDQLEYNREELKDQL